MKHYDAPYKSIFGNFWRALLLTEMQNTARNGKKVTEVLYRVADQSFYCHFWQLCDHLLPFLATTVIRQTVTILVKQNIARNGIKVIEVFYRAAD